MRLTEVFRVTTLGEHGKDDEIYVVIRPESAKCEADKSAVEALKMFPDEKSLAMGKIIVERLHVYI